MALGAYYSGRFNGAQYWRDVEDYWPRRLLHIPTMTSYQRDERYTYNRCERPKYSILSYTWGRWEKRQSERAGDEPESESLEVKGVSWRIPIISEEHFSVRMFQKVIDEMRRLAGTDWAWVDVACIDQENIPLKMDEVGRQASIFKNAWKAFSWLSHTSEESLVNAIAMTERAGSILHDIENAPGLLDNSAYMCILRAAEEVKDSVEVVLLDPWFSSLWTLQELFLRDDALILGKNGNISVISELRVPGFDESDPYLVLEALHYELYFILLKMIHLQETEKLCQDDNVAPRIQKIAQELSSLIIRCGFGSDGEFHPDNPNVQYGAAKFRQTVRPEDRVYAICQIYNIRVGQTLRPDEPAPELDNLIEEFGLAINARFPIISQLFVHTTSPQIGRSWCITQESEVPYLDQTLLIGMQSTSTLRKVDDGSIMATGLCCNFEEFHFAHLSFGIHSYFYVNLDPYILQLWDPNEELPSPVLAVFDSSDYYDLFQKHCGADNVRILLLGHSKGNIEADLNPFKKHLTPTQHYGILIQKRDTPRRPDSAGVYRRLGFCKWTTIKRSLGEHASSAEPLDESAQESGSRVTDVENSFEVVLQQCQGFDLEIERLFSKGISVTLV